MRVWSWLLCAAVAVAGPPKRRRAESPDPPRAQLGLPPDTFQLPQPGHLYPELPGPPRRAWSWFQPQLHSEELYLAVMTALLYLRWDAVQWLRGRPAQAEERVALLIIALLTMNFQTCLTYYRRSWQPPPTLLVYAGASPLHLQHPHLGLPAVELHRHLDSGGMIGQFDGPGDTDASSSSGGSASGSSPPTRPRGRAAQRFDAVSSLRHTCKLGLIIPCSFSTPCHGTCRASGTASSAPRPPCGGCCPPRAGGGSYLAATGPQTGRNSRIWTSSTPEELSGGGGSPHFPPLTACFLQLARAGAVEAGAPLHLEPGTGHTAALHWADQTPPLHGPQVGPQLFVFSCTVVHRCCRRARPLPQ